VPSLIGRASGFGGWLFQTSWAPQHVASAMCVVLACVLLAQLTLQRGWLLPAVIGLVAAAGFESSVWVGGIAFALAAAAIGLYGLSRSPAGQRGAFILGLAAAAVLAAVERRLPILSEKPIAVSAHQADAMMVAARKAGTFLGEAFMYRLHPQTAKFVDMIKSGAIGEVRGIKASFGFLMGNPDPNHRLLANDTAGGGILDICCYPVSVARLIAGAATGVPFVDPVKVVGAAHLGATGVDEWASAILQFPNDIIAEVSGGVSFAFDNTVRVYGTTGWLEVKSPWFATGKQGGTGDIVIHHADGKDETATLTEAT